MALCGADVVARELGVSTETVYALVRRGAITGYRVGGLLRFDLAQVRKNIEETGNTHKPDVTGDGRGAA